MIIVSQDKSEIVNFDRINYIQVSKIDKSKSVIEINYADMDWKTVVKYETEERAKEVLQEILEFYEISKRYECSSNNSITIFLEPKFVYQMPER